MKRWLTGWMAGVLGMSLAHAGIPIEHWTQANGAQVFLVQSPGLPMVDVQIDFDAGARRDPAGRAGLASATALMIGKGLKARGALPALDENAVGEAWADGGALFSASASSDRMSFTLRSLTRTEVLDASMRLAARHLADPAFAADIWTRERQRWSASLRESLTKPATVADRAWTPAVFGTHPYGQQTTPESLQAVSVADMQAFHAQHIVPCRAKVSVVGALNRAQVQAWVTALLAALPTGASCAALPVVPEVQPLTQAKEIFIPFESAQAHVSMGQPGYKRDDPDFFALTVGNYVLGGGGFVSRLTEQVREKRGLSYSVYSYFSPGLHAGPFAIGLQTRPDQARQAVEVARAVLKEFVEKGPTQAELQAAKDNLTGGFALRLDSNRKLLDNLANIAWHQLPLDYLDTWTQKVQALTVQDVSQAFARKVQPERQVTVVVGGSP
jgi:zinc protease